MRLAVTTDFGLIKGEGITEQGGKSKKKKKRATGREGRTERD
jgi:hypothetical protein